MSITKAKNFLNDILLEFDNDNLLFNMYENNFKNFLISFKNLSEFENVCDKRVLPEILKIIRYENDKFDFILQSKLKNEINNCKLRFKFLFIHITTYVSNKKYEHFNLLVIDYKKKLIERFDTRNEKGYFKKYAMDKLLKNMFKSYNFNFKIVHPSEFISEKGQDLGLCVPLSLLYGYLKIKFSLSLNETIKLMKTFSDKDLFRISKWFLSYLKKNF